MESLLALFEGVHPLIYVAAITVVPYIELRGAIPYGIAVGLNPLSVFLVSTFINVLIIYPAFIFLDWFFHLMEKIPVFSKAINKTRTKAKPYVEKYGMVGLGLFVAVPLPGTGAYSGALAAHIFGVKNKKALFAIAVGVLIAGILVTLISTAFVETLGWILPRI
ncbi:MAG: small multi-drug export protein [Candidatus Altiarchaeota archaeon]